MSNNDFDIRPPGWTNLDEARVINIKVRELEKNLDILTRKWNESNDKAIELIIQLRDVDAAYRKSSDGHIKAIKLMVAGALVMSCAAFFMVAL